MSIKRIFGFCDCKGCMNRGVYDFDLTLTTKEGKIKHYIKSLCEKHAIDLLEGYNDDLTEDDYSCQ